MICVYCISTWMIHRSIYIWISLKLIWKTIGKLFFSKKMFFLFDLANKVVDFQTKNILIFTNWKFANIKKKRLLKLKSWLNFKKYLTRKSWLNSIIQLLFNSKTTIFISIKLFNSIIWNWLKKSTLIQQVYEMWYDLISHQKNNTWFNKHEMFT